MRLWAGRRSIGPICAAPGCPVIPQPAANRGFVFKRVLHGPPAAIELGICVKPNRDPVNTKPPICIKQGSGMASEWPENANTSRNPWVVALTERLGRPQDLLWQNREYHAPEAAEAVSRCGVFVWRNALNKQPLKKRTMIMTNHVWLARSLEGHCCDGNHLHIRGMGAEQGIPLSKWCQVYPPQLCDTIASSVASSTLRR